MGILALAADERVAAVELTADELSVRLMDGRTISVPLVWYPRLLMATPEQRERWQISGGGYGIHWEEIDEDLSSEGLLRGAPAPRQALTTIRAHEKDENRISNKDNAGDKDLVVEDAQLEEKGVLDHLTEGEEAAAKLTSVLSMIQAETESIAAKTNRHASNLQQLNNRTQGRNAGDYKKIVLLAASDMNSYSRRIEGALPDFEKCMRVLNKSYSVYVEFAQSQSNDHVAEMSKLRDSLAQMLRMVGPAKISIMSFRDSTILLKNQNISKELNKAASRQSQALDGMVLNIEEIESFALGTSFLIDEKFGKPLH